MNDPYVGHQETYYYGTIKLLCSVYSVPVLPAIRVQFAKKGETKGVAPSCKGFEPSRNFHVGEMGYLR